MRSDFRPYFPLRIFRSAYLIHLAPPRHAPKTLIFIGPPTENDFPPYFSRSCMTTLKLIRPAGSFAGIFSGEGRLGLVFGFPGVEPGSGLTASSSLNPWGRGE